MDVQEERRWRNELYLGPETPLAPEARKAFQGLRWWPVDPRFRVPARLLRHREPLPGRVGATGADAVAMLEIGALEFSLLGLPARLFVYEPAPGEVDETYYLVPFRDATSGQETYGGGRYLDLEPGADAFELDFNRAYHPYCAYDDAWACTMPPPENRLPVRVEAGERLP
ncbi:MAG TPA: DUF1684 domain-containing protein [Candidatus Thermoplasmatota archaeon]|nr:DUF1684 domain-containing protein [Candidatus Thermoplasmatota archaeon]